MLTKILPCISKANERLSICVVLHVKIMLSNRISHDGFRALWACELWVYKRNKEKRGKNMEWDRDDHTLPFFTFHVLIFDGLCFSVELKLTAENVKMPRDLLVSSLRVVKFYSSLKKAPIPRSIHFLSRISRHCAEAEIRFVNLSHNFLLQQNEFLLWENSCWKFLRRTKKVLSSQLFLLLQKKPQSTADA